MYYYNKLIDISFDINIAYDQLNNRTSVEYHEDSWMFRGLIETLYKLSLINV